MNITMGLLQEAQYKKNQGRKGKRVIITQEEIDEAKEKFFKNGGKINEIEKPNNNDIIKHAGNQHLYISSDGMTTFNLPYYDGMANSAI